ncbi:MAG TPA: hypothetical protein DCS93_44500 [Microscillaceae bacterium]|nr:hypothetical protein [Microscillaceae bacterium]
MKLKRILLYAFILFVTISTSLAQVTYERAFPNLDFALPVEIQDANDGSNRLFVVEQEGRIAVFPNSNNVIEAQVSTFLQINVGNVAGEELGLLGLAFHPDFQANRYCYIYYVIDQGGGVITVFLDRYTVRANDPNSVDPSSQLNIFRYNKNQPETNHNGGKIAFGPDGYLYVSIGDGGGAGDPQRNAQDLTNPFGKILRIDVDVNGNNPADNNGIQPEGNYEIPSDNPLVGQAGMDEIYAWGIRNTWKFSFDRTNNRLWGGDVGQNQFEEINLIERGGNYGWNRFEGTAVFDNNVPVPASHRPPVYFYDHSQGDQSITGGYVYRGSGVTSANPSIAGRYIYGDFLTGRVWALDYNLSGSPTTTNTQLFQADGISISTFGQDEQGEIYFCNYAPGAIYRIVDGAATNPGQVVNGVGIWQQLSATVNGTVNAMAIDNAGNVYVGGEFTQAGTIAVNNIARYSPTDGWSALGSGTNGPVNAIDINTSGALTIGGSFTSVNGVTANNVAQYSGGVWSPLGSGTSGLVAVVKSSGNNIYIGGTFVNAGGLAVNNVALWNGSNWSALTDSQTNIAGTNNELRSIAIDSQGTIYVGGNFSTAGGKTAKRIATYSNGIWGTLGDGTSGFVQAIHITNNYIYAGGNFAIAGNQTVSRVARWNLTNNTWESLGGGVSGNINAITGDNNFVYLAGSFALANENNGTREIMNNIARWSQAGGWEALGQNTTVGTNNRINALVLSGPSPLLYAGGSYTQAGNLNTSYMASWTFNAPPIINAQTFNINSTSTNGTLVGTVVASDPYQDPLTFSILNGNVSGAFAINASTGTLTVADASQLASASSFALVVQVSDGQLQASATITINVLNGNVAPQINNQSFSVGSTSANGAQIGTVVASDPNQDLLAFSILSGNNGGAFAIGTATGILTVANASQLATTNSFALVVQVSDGQLQTNATITINVVNSNVAPQMNDQSFRVGSASTNGTQIGTVAASDVDQDPLTFSILSGNATGTFAIGTATGVLTVVDASRLTGVNSFSLVVQVSDGQLQTSATMTISVDQTTSITSSIKHLIPVSYPNPFQDILYIRDSRFVPHKVAVLQVFDQGLKKVMAKRIKIGTNKEVQVDLRDLLSGQYQMLLKMGDLIFNTRVIKN